ncbi:MAG: response regulator [Deltaproteobacteria bacterium]|nr:response regulator [Deltaproteobacteria bacterium]
MNKTHEKILLVDDDKLYREREKSFLGKRIACTILEAGGGREALEMIRRERPSLVLMDLFMRDMDGDECCSIVKADPEISDTVIIMLSVSEKTEDKRRCFFAGCDDFLTKPIQVVSLIEKLKQYLGDHFRTNVRIPLSSSIYFNYEEQGHSAFIINIAEDGLLIKSRVNVPVGTRIDARFSLPNVSGIIDVQCEVVRIEKEQEAVLENSRSKNKEEAEHEFGMAVKFILPHEDLKKAISEFQYSYII